MKYWGDRLARLSARTFALAANGGLLVVVAVVALMAFTAWSRPAPKAPTLTLPEPTAGAEGFAQVWVQTWLEAKEGDEAAVARLYPQPVDLRGAVPTVVLGTAAIGVEEVPARKPTDPPLPLSIPRYWSVLVAAVTDQGTRYFRVGVARNQRYMATTLPGDDTAPTGGWSPSLHVGSFDTPSASDPVAVAVARFLGALLTGDGELARYVAPGARIQPVRPAPYTSVALRRMSARPLPDGNIEVLAEADGVDAAGHHHASDYPLLLAQRAGRWEVAKRLPAPTLSARQSPPLPSVPAPIPAPTAVPPSTVPTTTTTRPVPHT